VAEQTSGDTTIKASAEEIMDVLTDFASYPKWTDFKSADVLKEDNQGRATQVRYEMKAPVIGDVALTLSYRYKANNGGMSWTSKDIEGGVKSIKGEYVLKELDEDETKVTYTTTVDLKMKVPSMLRKQGEKQIIRQALDGLKKRAERG
jgi:ribosome-associated toxin RatA of RatAB toxin-antitoxin module